MKNLFFLFCITSFIVLLLSCRDDDDTKATGPIPFSEYFKSEQWCLDHGYEFVNGECFCPKNKIEGRGQYSCCPECREPDTSGYNGFGEYKEYLAEVSDCICDVERMWVQLAIFGEEISQGITFFYKDTTTAGMPYFYDEFLEVIPMPNGLDSIQFYWDKFHCGTNVNYASRKKHYTARFTHPDTLVGNVNFTHLNTRGDTIEENCRLVFYR